MLKFVNLFLRIGELLKLQQLRHKENYFSNSDDRDYWEIDEKGYLTYKSIQTFVRFSTYIDFFSKIPRRTTDEFEIPNVFPRIISGENIIAKNYFPIDSSTSYRSNGKNKHSL